MNRQIYLHLKEKINEILNLPKYNEIKSKIDEKTIISELPWTPKRLEKFRNIIIQDLNVDNPDFSGTFEECVDRFEAEWGTRFWNSHWQARTEMYQYTGWGIVDVINKMNPRKVLDVGCGFNQFKARIPNLVGLDKYNNCADYMVDIIDFVDDPESYDAIIVFGSINFGTYRDVEVRMKKVFDLLAPGGKIFMRCNPGIRDRKYENIGFNWVDLYPWDFATATKLAKDYGIKLNAFKQDNGNRVYIEYEK